MNNDSKNNTFKGIENLKFINLEDNNKYLTKFIITFEKNKKHIGQSKDFHYKISDALYKYSSKIYEMNNFITEFDQIIIEEKMYFNIYIDLLNTQLTKKQIETIVLSIEGFDYKVHQVLDYGDLIEISIFKMIKYPYLSSILLLILEIIHTTSYTHNQILQSEIVKKRPDLCNTKLLKELVETISYFNKKKNDK